MKYREQVLLRELLKIQKEIKKACSAILMEPQSYTRSTIHIMRTTACKSHTTISSK